MDKVLILRKVWDNTTKNRRVWKHFLYIYFIGDQDLLETNNYKTWKFYDIEQDISSYKAISFDQARDIWIY
jgi:hypothetical protein